MSVALESDLAAQREQGTPPQQWWVAGADDEASLAFRRYYRHVRWNKGLRVIRKPLLLAYAGLWPLRATLSCAKQTAKYGRAVRDAAGVSVPRQFAEQWAMCVRDGCWPAGYYKFRLYLPERRPIARRFVHEHEALEVMRHVNIGPDMDVLDDKLKFAAACDKLGLPYLKTVACFEDGKLIEHETPDRPDDLPREDLFVKSTNLLCGRSAQRWKYDAAADVYESEGQRLTAAELVALIRRMSQRGAAVPLWKRLRSRIPKLGYEVERAVQEPRPYIVQRRIQNHPSIERFSNGALCTIRVVTTRAPGGEPQFIMAAFRMPCGAGVVDNFAAGGIASPIEPETGRLGPAVGKDPRRPTLESHPDSGQRIEGELLPFWNESRELCMRAHGMFREIATVGWDVALTPDGPKLVEANPIWCVELVQMAHGKPLGETPFVTLSLSHAEVVDGPQISKRQGGRRGGRR